MIKPLKQLLQPGIDADVLIYFINTNNSNTNNIFFSYELPDTPEISSNEISNKVTAQPPSRQLTIRPDFKLGEPAKVVNVCSLLFIALFVCLFLFVVCLVC